MDNINHPAALADTGYHAAVQLPLDAGFQSRWDAWIERGRVHDRRVRHRLVVSGAVLGTTAAAVAMIYALLQ
ncbi:MAG TPA: hypothetical protein VFS23_09180 [Vicinamibacterales bacterium]|nr:hypothetical protein [Vicinamibacterales bacterium]